MKVYIDDFNENTELYLSMVRENKDILEVYSDSGFTMKISLEEQSVVNERLLKNVN